MRSYSELLVWQKSHYLTLKVYSVSSSFPKEEMYGLTSQMRRSSSSIPTNIAEGCGRNSNAEMKRFLIISSGSSSELEYQLLLVKDLKYIDETLYKELSGAVVEIRKMIQAFIKALPLT
ncbi:four helix bundle protein [Mucilaginibacter arboris]|uniref:Four helix bundle protein n=1 Tax=Mucilaginibacter arboris TaxID=2682090 RepID=A0A7K1SZ98_9SPHI|nr:four helix bundle protein [Mucilaginibacter arboris]MVN22646.1 four helix bundle protein [Mucilaginibacter arboris]